jgi:hypothetical protein
MRAMGPRGVQRPQPLICPLCGFDALRRPSPLDMGPAVQPRSLAIIRW